MKKTIFAAALLVANVAQATSECTLRELDLAQRMFENEHDANVQRARVAQSEAMRARPDLADEIYGIGRSDPMSINFAVAAAEDRKHFLKTCDAPKLGEAIHASRLNLQYEGLRLSRLTKEPRNAK